MEKEWSAFLIILSLIIFITFAICSQVKEYHLQDDPMIFDLIQTIKPVFNDGRKFTGLLEPLNNRNILDEISIYKGDKSYSINKEKIYLCLRNKENDYYNKHTLIYVLAHEISHCICDEIGHTEKFHQIFEELLEEFTKEGIYNPSIIIPEDYCKHD